MIGVFFAEKQKGLTQSLAMVDGPMSIPDDDVHDRVKIGKLRLPQPGPPRARV